VRGDGNPQHQKKSRRVLAVGTKVGVWEVHTLAQSSKPVGSRPDTWRKYFAAEYFAAKRVTAKMAASVFDPQVAPFLQTTSAESGNRR
jgi:hypothetical protein